MNKDVNRLKAIIKYCNAIEDAIAVFGGDIEDFTDNQHYQYSCSFSISQIGENAKDLSPELTKKFPEINWNGMRLLRNDVAHRYEGIDLEMVWVVIREKIPEIKDACEKILYGLEH